MDSHGAYTGDEDRRVAKPASLDTTSGLVRHGGFKGDRSVNFSGQHEIFFFFKKERFIT
jgi:hypothetical protein